MPILERTLTTPFDHGLGVFLGGFVVINLGEQTLVDHFFNRGVRQVGVNRDRPVSR